MEFDGGFTPIDTLYEWSGLVLAERFADTLLWSRLFVGIVIAAAILRLFYISQKKQSYFDLVAYPVYLAFMLFLVSPVTVTVRPKTSVYNRLWDEMNQAQVMWGGETKSESVGRETFQVRVPRIIGVAHRLTDGLIRQFVGGLANDVGYTLFRWQAVVAGMKQASILDPQLSGDFHTFLRYCYWPAHAARGASSDEDGGAVARPLPLREPSDEIYSGLDMPLSVSWRPCTTMKEALNKRLRRHVAENEVHTQAIQAGAELGQAREVEESYLTRLIYNETFGGGSGGEMARLKNAVPDYSSWDQQYMGTAKVGTVAQGASGLLGMLSSFWEGSSQETLGPTLYYRLTLFAPYLYGLLQAVILMAFPIAGLWSLWPGSWMAILNFLKLWTSIKIWPVFWTFLSSFNIYRLNLPTDDPLGVEGTGGSAAMFASVAAMYVLVPVLSYMVMNLVSQAGMLTISAFTGAGTGAGPAIGTITAGVSAAGRLAR
jgi:hypothetical protein